MTATKDSSRCHWTCLGTLGRSRLEAADSGVTTATPLPSRAERAANAARTVEEGGGAGIHLEEEDEAEAVVSVAGAAEDDSGELWTCHGLDGTTGGGAVRSRRLGVGMGLGVGAAGDAEGGEVEEEEQTGAGKREVESGGVRVCGGWTRRAALAAATTTSAPAPGGSGRRRRRRTKGETSRSSPPRPARVSGGTALCACGGAVTAGATCGGAVTAGGGATGRSFGLELALTSSGERSDGDGDGDLPRGGESERNREGERDGDSEPQRWWASTSASASSSASAQTSGDGGVPRPHPCTYACDALEGSGDCDCDWASVCGTNTQAPWSDSRGRGCLVEPRRGRGRPDAPSAGSCAPGCAGEAQALWPTRRIRGAVRHV